MAKKDINYFGWNDTIRKLSGLNKPIIQDTSNTLPELREKERFTKIEARYSEFFSDKLGNQTDFDIFLKTKNRNLQRPYVWKQRQKEELINSIILNKYVPPITVIRITLPFSEDGLNNRLSRSISNEDFFTHQYLLIDGKQRLMTVNSFVNNEFKYKGFLFKKLPPDYQRRITSFEFNVFEKSVMHRRDISDEYLIDLFLNCNYSGTPQEQEHFDDLLK